MQDKLPNDKLTTRAADLVACPGRDKQTCNILFILMVMMMGSSLFLPRSFLSVSMILFLAVSLIHTNFTGQVRNFLRTPFLWGMSVFFLLAFISGLWSEDYSQWSEIIRIKLPLLFMPLAFAGSFGFSRKKFETLAFLFILLVFFGTAETLWQYISDPAASHAGYLRSNLLKTPLENDHVRFSWLVNAAIVAAGWLYVEKRAAGSIISKWLPVIIGWLVIYLHLLAARTGLLCLYATLAITAAWWIWKKRNILAGAIIIAGLFVLPLIAYQLLPTFHNRVKYFLYDLSYTRKSQYLEGGNDATRVISLKAGWAIMNENPLKGVGFGDIRQHTNKWYEAQYPQMLEADKILPGNEWMMYGAGCGWPGCIIFSLLMLLPFWVKNIQSRLPWIILHTTVLLTCMTDIGLEVQFGVFQYSFVTLWWWKWYSVKS